MIVDGSDNETKFRTIPSALGKNLSSREVITSILDLIGRNTKKPTHPANNILEMRIIKPAIKKLTTTIQKKFGKEPPKLSRNEIQCNKYREKKGLPPFKLPKKKKKN